MICGAPDIFSGPQFTLTAFTEFLQIWGVAHCLSYVSYPQSNGRAEATVVTVHVKCMQTALHMHKNLCTVYPAHTDHYALRKKQSLP